ncbi:MAG: thioredoxin domain-containing protein [Myxococcota bacterium]
MSNPDEDRVTNRLANETSAYLRQHMHNPVDWYPWGPDGLERARAEDKPLLISIGYSACHWCHVMERESFENPAIAQLMNEGFVCIKVDREERPDVDQVYMDAVTRFIGRGGWPLTAFCNASGAPFYGGTYFPPEPRHGMPGFGDLLVQIAKIYRERRSDVEQTAIELLSALDQRATGVADELPSEATITLAARHLMQGADRRNGGFGEAPKFPSPPSLELLMAAADALPPDEADDAVSHVASTCRSMARGGVFDHLAGGFHRYSVDTHWGIPHFEKMLYDQGQLIRVYAEAWRRTGADELLWPIRETVSFLCREMAAPDGGFFASVDADSDGAEGQFYAWTPEQIASVIGDARAQAFNAAYGVTETGNFDDHSTVLREIGDGPRSEFATEREQLRIARGRRVAPGTDTKRLTAWNGLLISGLARAGSLLDDRDMLDSAAATADFLLKQVIDDNGRPLRIFDRGTARIPAFLDDLAALLEACLDLQRAGAGDRYFDAALNLAEDVATRFFDLDHGDLYFCPDDGEQLIIRPRTDHDGATPQSTGLAAMGLVRVAALGDRADLRKVADQLFRTHAFALQQAPEAFPTLARAVLAAQRGICVAVIVTGDDDTGAETLASTARRTLRPEDAVIVSPSGQTAISPHWLLGREAIGGRATAYLCRGFECSLPVHSPDELAALC